MMRVASALLVAVLLSTCAISSTFAKYVTSDSSGDVARVAKWGVVVSVTGTLYGEKYAAEGDGITASEDEDTVSVKGTQSTSTNGTNNVVAPGTSSDEGFHIAVNGKPEVDTVVNVEANSKNIFLAKGKYGVMVKVTDVTQDNFVANCYYQKDTNGNYTLIATWPEQVSTEFYRLKDEVDVTFDNGYWPVIYTMTGAQGDISYTDGTVYSDSLASIATALSMNNKSVEQNKSLSDELKLSGLGISWKWAIEQDYVAPGGTANAADDEEDQQTTAAETFKKVCNGADTILANLMAKRIDGDTGTDFVGEVVKLGTDDSTYSAPNETTDYCLDTRFNIEITVTQVD